MTSRGWKWDEMESGALENMNPPQLAKRGEEESEIKDDNKYYLPFIYREKYGIQ